MRRALAVLAFFAFATAATAQEGTHFPRDYQGLWWNPAESGWGVGVFDHGGPISSVLFAYGADGRPTWYVAPDLRNCPGDLPPWLAITCRGAIYQTTGPWFGGAFSPSSVTVREVGSWSAYFTGMLPNMPYSRPREMDLTLTIDGMTFHRDNLLPQDIVGSALSNFDPAMSTFTGLWWNPEESGWGVGLFHYRNVVFAVLFVYGADRQPTWFVSVLRESFPPLGAQAVPSRYFDGPIFETRGTSWQLPSFALSQVRQVGAAQLVFPNDAPTATLTYSVDGVTVQKTLRRQSLAPS